MRKKITDRLRRVAIMSLALSQLFFFPVSVRAQEQPTEDSVDTTSTPASESTETPSGGNTETEPAESKPETGAGVTGEMQPTGAASNTYTENEDGTWENEHYIWDPVTKQTKPKNQPTYSYNPATKMWDTTEWYYRPETGRYEANVVSTPVNPAPAANGSRGSITNTGPNSNNTVDLSGGTKGTFNLFYDGSISNNVYIASQSGNAVVQGNTNAGDARSGDSQSIANILNLLQSQWGDLGSQDIATFVANIDGDVVGDLYVDPAAIVAGSGNTDLEVNAKGSGLIDNDVEVVAGSGEALVRDNTNAGSAQSGNSRAVVNLINMINSAISAKKSFVGVLNINGTLEGDILLPENQLLALLAATGPNSNNQINSNNNKDVNVNSTTNNSINNNIDADASSGSANVSGNTTAGSAKTGEAQTNLTVLNLTGKKVIAKNALLVFVNVMGEWVGLIMDAPAGSYAVAATGPNSNNTINDDRSLNVDANIEENNTINNDVKVRANSGDAEVSNNSNAGDASSGDAYAGVNILNLVDSDLQIDDWFGVLFINVFGTWRGSFGVNTAYGDSPAPDSGVAPENATQQTVSASSSPASRVFNFVPRAYAASTESQTSAPAVQGSSDNGSGISQQQEIIAQPTIATKAAGMNGNLVISGVALLGAILLLGGERLVTASRRLLSRSA